MGLDGRRRPRGWRRGPDESGGGTRASLADRLDDTTYRWSDLVYQGMRAIVSGRFSDADTTLWQALEVGRLPLGDHANRFFGLQLLKLSEMRGQGQPMLAPARAYAEQLGYVTAYVSLAHLHVELGNFDHAGELIEQHVPHDLGGLLSTYDRLPTLALLARIAQLRNDTDLAARVAVELVPSAGQLCVHADAVLYGSVAHNLGRCALTTGDGASALDWLDLSERIYDDLDARAWLLLLESDRCDALELQGDHEQAMQRRARLTIEANKMGLAMRTAL
jgi:tetratricopeptide (TPR) repeat protein